jgi:hypothetical protein
MASRAAFGCSTYCYCSQNAVGEICEIALKNDDSFIKGQIRARNKAYILGTAYKRCLQIDSSALATKPYLML